MNTKLLVFTIFVVVVFVVILWNLRHQLGWVKHGGHAGGSQGGGTQSGGPSTPLNPPIAPVLKNASLISDSTDYTVSWNLVPQIQGDASVTGYVILQCLATNTHSWNQVGQASSGETEFAVVGKTVAGSNYYVVVYATSSVGNSEYSNTMGIDIPSVAPPPVTVPDAPTQKASTGVTTKGFTVNWILSSDGDSATTVTVQIAPSGTSNFSTVNTVKATANSLIIGNLSSGTKYDTIVFATNSAGNSINSNVVTTTTTSVPPPQTVPNAPTALIVTPVSATSYKASWTAPTTGPTPTGYVVMDRVDGSTKYTAVASVATITTTVQNLTANTEYDVVVYATNSSGSSQASDMETVQLPAIQLVPSTPVISSLVGTTSTTYTLKWIDNPVVDQVIHYLVQQSTDGTKYTTVDTASPNSISYTSGQLLTNTTYYVRLVAVNAVGNSNPSKAASVELMSLPSAPSEPSLTQATDTSYTVTWSANPQSDEVTSYLVQESTDGTNWTTIYTATKSLTYTATGRTTGDTYYVQIVAVNSDGDSDPSPFNNITLLQMEIYPSPPTGLTFARNYKGGNYSAFTLTWDSNPSAENTTSYNIYTNMNAGQFELFDTVSTPTTTYNGYANEPYDNFQAYITSVNKKGESQASKTVNCQMMPLPSAVKGVTVVGDQDEDGYTVSWSSNPPQDQIIQYDVYVSLQGDVKNQYICTCWEPNASGGSCVVGNSMDPINTVTITADNFPSGLGTFDLGTEYDVYVYAQNATGQSATATPVTTSAAYPPDMPVYYPRSGNYGPTVGQVDDRSFYFSWIPATTGFPATSYTITYQDFVTQKSKSVTITAAEAVNTTQTGYACKTIVQLDTPVTILTIYSVSVQGVNSAGTGYSGGPLEVLMCPPPPAPSNIVATPDPVNPVYTVTWTETMFNDPNNLLSIIQDVWAQDPNYSPMGPIVGYYVQDKTIDGTDSYSVVATVNAITDAVGGDGINTPYTYSEVITGSYGVDYDVVVVPYNATGNGSGSKALTVDVAPSQTIPPTSVNATSTKPGTIDVAWTPATPDYATSYIIEYELTSDQQGDWVQVDTKGIATSKTVTGISSGSSGGVSYSVRVAAENSAGYNSGQYVNVLVMPSSPPPQPGQVYVDKITTNSYEIASYCSVDLTSGLDDGSVSFVFQHSPTGKGKWVTDATIYVPGGQYGNDQPSASTVVTASLVLGGTYDVRVYVVNAAGTAGKPSPIQTIQLLQPATAPDAPTIQYIEMLTTNALVYLYYPTPNKGGEIDYYDIQYQAEGGKWTDGGTFTDTSTGASITGLTPGVSYNFRASAVNNSGNNPLVSKWSSIYSGTTLFYGADCSGGSQSGPGTCVVNAAGTGAYLDMVECGKGCTNAGNTSPMTVTFTVNGDSINSAPAYQLYRWNGTDPGPTSGTAPSTPLLTTVNQPAQAMPSGSLQGTFDGTQFPNDWYEGAVVCAWMCTDDTCSDLTPTSAGSSRGSPCWTVPSATSQGANYNPGFGGFPIPGM